MNAIRVQVKNGKLVGEAPPGLREGEELDLCLSDPGDQMTAEETEALDAALDAAWRSIEAGRFRPASEIIDELRRT